MNFRKILSTFLKQFKSSKIYERGLQYFENGMVYDLNYDSEQNRIFAQIEGSQRNFYSAEIALNGQQVSAHCTCLYDGSICKHVIATILIFLENHQTYVNHEKENRKKLDHIKGKLNSLSKTDLVDFILRNAEKSPDFKRNLLIKFGDNKDAIIKTITKNIESACRKFEAGNENSKEFAMKFRNIFESLKESDPKIKLHISWIIADRIIGFLNEYGIGDDEALEDIVFENLEITTELLDQNKNDELTRKMILKRLLAHYLKHNCGIMDYVLEAIFKICVEKSDYEVLVNETERAHQALKENDPYYKDLMEDLMKDLKDMRDKTGA